LSAAIWPRCVATCRLSTTFRMNMATARKMAGSTVPMTLSCDNSSSTILVESWRSRATAPNAP
jgi:hypothetical protein